MSDMNAAYKFRDEKGWHPSDQSDVSCMSCGPLRAKTLSLLFAILALAASEFLPPPFLLHAITSSIFFPSECFLYFICPVQCPHAYMYFARKKTGDTVYYYLACGRGSKYCTQRECLSIGPTAYICPRAYFYFHKFLCVL